MSERSPESARQVKALIHQARAQLERGQPREAMKLFHEVLRIEPNHPHVQQWVAKLGGRMKRPAGVAAAGAAVSAPPKVTEETVLSSVKTDVYASRGTAEPVAHKPPARPRTKKSRAEAVDAVELDTTVLGVQQGPLDRTVPLLHAEDLNPPAAAPQSELDTTVPGRFPRSTERERAGGTQPRDGHPSRQVKRPWVESGSRLAEFDEVEAPLDTADPDVASLLSGSAQISALRRLAPIAIGAGVLFLVSMCFVAFNQHSGTYRAKLEPGALELSVQKGAFFFSGWGDPQKVPIGYDAAWQQRLGKPELLKQLQEGVVVDSAPEIDHLVVSLYTDLGEQALARGDSASLLEAIFYLKGARRVYERTQPMPPEEQAVRQKLTDALLRFADYRIGRQELAQAKDTLEQVRQYDPSNAGLAERVTRLSQPPPTPVPVQPTPKKPPKKPKPSP